MSSDDVAMEIENYKKVGLFTRPNDNVLNFLDLKRDEAVLINLRLFPLRSIFINNIRERYAKHLILTTERIIFVVNRGWLLKEFFLYSEVVDVFITRKWNISDDCPGISIKTHANTYEILFATLCPYKKKIRGIIDCIKKRNATISVRIDKSYEDDLIRFIKESFFTDIKLK